MFALALAETLTDIQYNLLTRQEMMDWTACNFDPNCNSDDNHFYAILADGKTADDEYDTCTRTDLRSAYEVTVMDESGTYWFFTNAAKKDEQLLEDEVSREIMGSLDLYMDIEDGRDYTADELIGMLKAAIAEKEAA